MVWNNFHFIIRDCDRDMEVADKAYVNVVNKDHTV